ncbi:MAG TPA: delta-60 repeat domain-containing protein [Pyrinomonadaceae bacterium]|nr:delta-60 repeat domain-containing protein [Pyrinomonadaceae bacterium]
MRTQGRITKQTLRIYIFGLWLILFATLNSVQAGYVLDDFDPHPDHHVHAIVVQPDGKILIGGSFNSVSPISGSTDSASRFKQSL